MSATPKQMAILIDYMELHPDLAKGYKANSVQGKFRINKMWDELAAILNADGLPTKNVTAWRKVWTDFKYRAKKKCSQNLMSIQKTGGGPAEVIYISEQEEKVIQMTSLRSAVSGSSSNIFGAPSKQEPMEALQEDEQEEDELEGDLRGLVESPVLLQQTNKTEEFLNPRKRNSTPYKAAGSSKRAKENDSTIEQILKQQIERDTLFQDTVTSILKERNQQEAIFHAKVISLLEKRNEIAEKQLKK